MIACQSRNQTVVWHKDSQCWSTHTGSQGSMSALSGQSSVHVFNPTVNMSLAVEDEVIYQSYVAYRNKLSHIYCRIEVNSWIFMEGR